MSQTQSLGIALPKLPEIPKEDIEAVRRFFPGKLLGRTAALLSLVLLVIGLTAVRGMGLTRLGVPLSLWLLHALLIGLPVLAVVAQLVLEWRAERNRRKLKELAVQLDPEQSGYFRIGPYLDTSEDRAKFRRADHAHEKVLRWIETSQNSAAQSERLPLYLTGDLGVGEKLDPECLGLAGAARARVDSHRGPSLAGTGKIVVRRPLAADTRKTDAGEWNACPACVDRKRHAPIR